MDNHLVYIKESSIQGVGVFSREFIKKRTKIADYYGEEMNWKDFKNKYGDYKNNSLNTYPMRRLWRIIVAKEEPYKSKNITNFINEDRENSNVELKKRALYAKEDIQKNTELLLNYPKDYNRTWEV
jgi:SET domain-containing protein